MLIYPDSKVHGANMGPTWVLSAPDGPHVGPMNLAIRVVFLENLQDIPQIMHYVYWYLVPVDFTHIIQGYFTGIRAVK